MALLAFGGVFLADTVITFLAIKEREAWIDGKLWRSIVVDALGAVAITASIILIAEYSWVTLPASIAGVVAGRLLAWRY